MSKTLEVKVPDIGDFKNVAIIELHVAVGDVIKQEQSIITIESDKAAMEIPSPAAGVIKSLQVKLGDKVSEGSALLVLELAETAAAAPAPTASSTPSPVQQSAPQAAAIPAGSDMHAEVLVLGAGPGGYSAAFRAADLGKKVTLVERYSSLGGVCLNVGCIPSKALLHTAQIINEAEEMSEHGVKFTKPKINLKKLLEYKQGIIKRLTGGLAGLAKQRKVDIVNGVGEFTSPKTLKVTTPDGVKIISFDSCIIAQVHKR